MLRKNIPVYDINNLSVFNQKDILISRFAPYLAIHPNLHLAHKHSFYHLILFTEGRGTHTIDFHQFDVRPFQIYFMIPGQVHSWSFEGHVDGYVVNFSGLFFSSFLLKQDYLEQFAFFRGNVNDAVIDIPEDTQAAVQQLFEQLVAESEMRREFGVDVVKAGLLQLFYTISRIHLCSQDDIKHSQHHLLLNNFKKLIDRHYTTIRLPKAYAQQLHVTPNHLNAVCNELLGVSAGELIRNRIVLEAKRQLINLDTRVSEIGYQLNFDDNSNFTKFFKNQVGITPEQFRSSMTNTVQQKATVLR